jgi:hypothetical protein
MLVDKIIVDCIQQSDTFGKDTLIFKSNGVKIFQVSLSSGETRDAELTDLWIVEADYILSFEQNNSLFPNKILLSYLITAEDINNRYFNLEINDGCNYRIRIEL